ncbi:MAG: hypothetical protein A2Y21_03280 [Clostridiales bacterium GWC2_40_7]|nr:MAG: hypothetical protein A2Y21_03280 [Clostridiales bacterium GWC2_40_7]
MVWIMYFLLAVLATFIFTRFKNIKRLWVMGLVTMLFLYVIDNTLINLGAYSFKNPISVLGGIPLFYLLAGFPGGILLAYFYPPVKRLQLPYVLLSSAIFIFLEIIINWLGYIRYLNWNLLKSYILNIGGFMAILWLGQWLNATGKDN